MILKSALGFMRNNMENSKYISSRHGEYMSYSLLILPPLTCLRKNIEHLIRAKSSACSRKIPMKMLTSLASLVSQKSCPSLIIFCHKSPLFWYYIPRWTVLWWTNFASLSISLLSTGSSCTNITISVLWASAMKSYINSLYPLYRFGYADWSTYTWRGRMRFIFCWFAGKSEMKEVFRSILLNWRSTIFNVLDDFLTPTVSLCNTYSVYLK